MGGGREIGKSVVQKKTNSFKGVQASVHRVLKDRRKPGKRKSAGEKKKKKTLFYVEKKRNHLSDLGTLIGRKGGAS